MPITPPRSRSATRYLSVATVADRLEVSVKTVRRLIASGDLPVHQFGHSLLVSEDDLQTFAASRRRRVS